MLSDNIRMLRKQPFNRNADAGSFGGNYFRTIIGPGIVSLGRPVPQKKFNRSMKLTGTGILHSGTSGTEEEEECGIFGLGNSNRDGQKTARECSDK